MVNYNKYPGLKDQSGVFITVCDACATRFIA